MAKKQEKPKTVGGPFLAAALICDTFLDDAKGRVSAIGISDGCTFYITHDAPDNVPSRESPAMLQQNLLLMFRSGDSPGTHRLKLVVEQPNGERKNVWEKDIELSKPLHGGIHIKTHASFAVFSQGVFWIDVYLDKKLVTRMPYNVAFQRLPPPSQTTATSVEVKE